MTLMAHHPTCDAMSSCESVTICCSINVLSPPDAAAGTCKCCAHIYMHAKLGFRALVQYRTVTKPLSEMARSLLPGSTEAMHRLGWRTMLEHWTATERQQTWPQALQAIGLAQTPVTLPQGSNTSWSFWHCQSKYCWHTTERQQVWPHALQATGIAQGLAQTPVTLPQTTLVGHCLHCQH